MGRKITFYNYRKTELAESVGISPRRAQVLELVARGCTSRDIAAILGIGEDCAKSHIENLRNQLSAANRAELVSQAWAHGLLRASEGEAMFCLRQAKAKPVSTSWFDRLFHRAQEIVKSRPRVLRDQRAVDLAFYCPAPGSSEWHTVPAFMRKGVSVTDWPTVSRITEQSNYLRSLVRSMDYDSHTEQSGVQAVLRTNTQSQNARIRPDDGHHGIGAPVWKRAG